MKDERQSTQADEAGVPEWSADNLRVALGARVRRARNAAGMSQQAVADAMSACGFSWRQTTVAKTEAADRPTLFTEVVALSHILKRDLKYFLTDRIELDDLKDELAQEAEAARERVRAAEAMLASARMEEHRVGVQEGIALAIAEYTYTGDTGPLRSSVDIFSDSPSFSLDACMKVLNVAGIPREFVKEIDRIAMQEAALGIRSTGQATIDGLGYGFKQEDIVQEARKYLDGGDAHPLFLRLLRNEKVYRGYAAQLLVDLVAEKVEPRDG